MGGMLAQRAPPVVLTGVALEAWSAGGGTGGKGVGGC